MHHQRNYKYFSSFEIFVGVGHKDEVIVPDITFGAIVMSVKLTAKLVIVDVNEKNLGFDLNKLEKKINKKTKAIIPYIFLVDC